EAAVAQLLSDKTFVFENTLGRNLAINIPLAFVPAPATEAKIGAKVAYYAVKFGAETLIEVTYESLVNNRDVATVAIETAVGNIAGEAAGAIARRTLRRAFDWVQSRRRAVLGPDEVNRRQALGHDPATGRHRPNEELTALRLEGKTGAPLERYYPDPGQKGDWIDKASGLVYDGCSPAPSAHFERSWKSYMTSLSDHLKHPTVDRVVVDVTDLGLKPQQIKTLITHLKSLATDAQSRIVRIGF
ncbi:MAG: hypothetical protein GY946_30505, partial [bacterium]|nr:hypothetical protein [bacterium]